MFLFSFWRCLIEGKQINNLFYKALCLRIFNNQKTKRLFPLVSDIPIPCRIQPFTYVPSLKGYGGFKHQPVETGVITILRKVGVGLVYIICFDYDIFGEEPTHAPFET